MAVVGLLQQCMADLVKQVETLKISVAYLKLCKKLSAGDAGCHHSPGLVKIGSHGLNLLCCF